MIELLFLIKVKSRNMGVGKNLNNSNSIFSRFNYRTFAILAIALTQLPLFLSYKSDGPLYIIGITLLVCSSALMVRCVDSSPIVGVIQSGVLFRVFFIAFLFSWIILVFVHYSSFEYNNFDTGIFANEIANFRDHGRFYSSVLEVHALGEHFNPNLLLFVPLFCLANTFLWLPIVKVIAFMACPLILLAISREILGKKSSLIYFAPMLWMTHRYLYQTMTMEFQPSSLALPFVLLGFLFALKHRTIPMVIVLIFLLGFKEQLPLVWVSIGIFLIIFQKRNKLGFVILSMGIVLGVLIYFVIMPQFANAWPTAHYSRFGPFEMIQKKMLIIPKALLSVALIPLLVPRTLLFIIPAFGLTLMSNHPLMLTFDYHYQDVPLTVMFVGLVFGLRAWQEQKPQWIFRYGKRLQVLLTCAALLTLIGWHNRYPMRLIKKDWPTSNELALLREINEIRNVLPKEEKILVMDFLGPHFFDYKEMKSISSEDQIKKLLYPATVLASDYVLKWPLSEEDYARLKRHLDTGRYKIITKPYQLLKGFKVNDL